VPAKRIIFVGVGPGKLLTYALRADVPETAEVKRPSYQSSYADPNDPDIEAIRAGTVIEAIKGMEAHPEPGETNVQALLRIQAQLEAEWNSFQSVVSRMLVRSKTLGRYWDGTEWSKYEPDA
jgi:hypothetical protein